MAKRKQYSKEFKLDAISLVTEQNYSVVEAANNLGITRVSVLTGHYNYVPI